VQAFQIAGGPLAPPGEIGWTHKVDPTDAPVKQVRDGHGLRHLKDAALERRNMFEG
jgi:hypothetical protein